MYTLGYMQLSTAAATLPAQEIRQMMELAWATPGAIHLEVGEPNFPTPAHVRAAAAAAIEAGETRYTPNAGLPQLRAALADKLRTRNGYGVDPRQVIVTNGGIQALFLAFTALLNAGDEILLPDPGWPNFHSIAHLVGATAVAYPLRPEDGYHPRAEDLERLVTPATKALVLVTPSNPVGAVLTREDIETLADFADAHDLWLIADECYDGITFDERFASVAAVAAVDAERVISVYSFSKTYAMTGWRVGYAVVPERIAAKVALLQEPLISCVNAPAQFAALAAVTGTQAPVAEMSAHYRRRRDALLALLAERGLPAFAPSGAFYLWLDVSRAGLRSFEFARRLLAAEGVAVAPGSAFGRTSDGFVRMSLAAGDAELVEGAGRLATFVAQMEDAATASSSIRMGAT
jgi:aspartate aminotransferase